MPIRHHIKFLWMGLGWLSIALGIAGAVLPLLPTTPFLLLAAFSFSRGSDRLHDWLIGHPRLGPPIVDWRDRRVITRTTKIYASLSMVAIVALALILQAPYWALAMQLCVLAAVAAFLWSQKEA